MERSDSGPRESANQSPRNETVASAYVRKDNIGAKAEARPKERMSSLAENPRLLEENRRRISHEPAQAAGGLQHCGRTIRLLEVQLDG